MLNLFINVKDSNCGVKFILKNDDLFV